jgi:hypothetical protein
VPKRVRTASAMNAFAPGPHNMQAFRHDSLYAGPYSSLNPGLLDRLGVHSPFRSRCFQDRPWNDFPPPFDPFTHPVVGSEDYPFCSTDFSPFDETGPNEQSWSGSDVDSGALWSRGVSSPCFRHDHHLIIRNSAPPFSAGSWELDRRQMIEVQFDQFGVASHCRSTWGRMGPWRADRYRYSVEEAYSKLHGEIAMLISRLGHYLNDHVCNPGQRFDGIFPPWVDRAAYGYPIHDFRYAQLNICRLGFPRC